MRHISAFYDRLIALSGALPGVIIVVLALCIGFEVASRNFGYEGLYWILEIVEYGLLILTMFGAAYVLHIGRHVTVDIIISLFAPKTRRYVDVAINIVVVAVAAVICYYGAATAWQAYEEDSILYDAIEIAEWIPMSVVPLGMGLFTIEAFLGLIRAVRGTKQPPAPRQTPNEVF